jgi:uncharacterized membrane protein
MVLLGMMAERSRDEARLFSVVSQVVLAAHRVFIPGTVLVLVFGVLMVWTGGLAWSDAWISLALVGIVVTGGLGARVLTPMAERIATLSKDPSKQPEAYATARRLIAVAKFDMVMLFSIVLLMVAKPGWSDWPILLVVAAALALAAVAFLRPERRVEVPA